MQTSPSFVSKQAMPAASCDQINVLTSFGVAPLLVALVGGQLAMQAVQQLGAASEEIFRGELLPSLRFPEPTQHNMIE
jgi:hypothetical protein